MVIFVVYLVVKAVWIQMDIAGEFRHGAVSTDGFFFFPFFTFPAGGCSKFGAMVFLYSYIDAMDTP